MSVLLASDQLELYPGPGAGKDAHGWALPGDEPAWSGKGSLQLVAGQTNTDASIGGGAGPYDPASYQVGNVYLPPEAPAAEGMVLRARDRRYVLGSLRLVVDPVDGCASCQVASVSEFEP